MHSHPAKVLQSAMDFLHRDWLVVLAFSSFTEVGAFSNPKVEPEGNSSMIFILGLRDYARLLSCLSDPRQNCLKSSHAPYGFPFLH